MAERRQLTVFFADIAGSTALAERLDPEDLQELLAQYQSACAEVIQRYEGHLAQYLGDGVLAYFGYPAAHEDDPSRAVLAGLDILDRLTQMAGERPQMRVGIHTGLVVVGDVGGGERREQLALGEAPNIAARVQAEAEPDTVVISDATRRLVAGQFALESLGSRTLKGVSKPVELFQVRGRSGAATRFQAMATARGLTPLVGREREIETIRGAWRQAIANHGGAILLRGPAGMGKSRLLEAARQISADSAHEVFEAQCSPYQVNSPLAPIAEMLERSLGFANQAAAEDKLDALAEFVGRRAAAPGEAAAALAELFSIPTLGRYSEIDIPPARRRQWMIDVLAGVLLHGANGAPVLLLVEDLHWADPSTLDLLTAMVAKLSSLPALIIWTARLDFSSPWQASGSVSEILVDALPAEETRALIARVAGQKPLPLTLREEIVARTGGTPLFVEAMTRTVIESGILRELPDRYELTGPLPPGLIPATVQDSLMGRIDKLGADRPVAQLAATIGGESSFELLQTVSGRSTEDLTAALRRLVDLELVFETGAPPSSSYTFRHALVQDAAYESLLRKTRQEFHSRIAEVLTARFPDLADTRPELLARHFEGAGRTADAITGWMKAGRQAQVRSAVREWVAHLQKAISLLQTLPPDDPGRLELEMEAQLSLSYALMAAVGWAAPEVEHACLRARQLSERLGNTRGLFATLWGLWSVYLLRGVIPKSLEVANSLLALGGGNPSLELMARQAAAWSHYFLSNFTQAREHAEKGVALYDPDRERELAGLYQLPLTCACGEVLAQSLWFMGYPEQAERAIQHALHTIELLNLPACTVYGLAISMVHLHLTRRADELVRRSERVYTLALAEGHIYWAIWGRLYRGWARAMESDAAGGAAEVAAGIHEHLQSGATSNIPQAYLMLGEAEWRAGRLDEALDALRKGLERVRVSEERAQEAELHRVIGEILIESGDATQGEASLRRAIEIAQAQKAKMPELRSATALAKLWRAQGRAAEACALLEPLYAWFQEGFDIPDLRAAQTLLASLGRSAMRRASARGSAVGTLRASE